MTKKKSQKKKVIVKVNPGEAIFVANLEVLTGIMDNYAAMAKESKDPKSKEAYSDIVSQILDWTTRTFYSGQGDGDDGDEEEW
jgi:hypothetical protein